MNALRLSPVTRTSPLRNAAEGERFPVANAISVEREQVMLKGREREGGREGGRKGAREGGREEGDKM
jgi:hypothetical protein